MLPSQRLHERKYTTFLLLQVIRDFMFHVLPFAVVKVVTGCKYNLHNLHRVLLHRKIPGSCISSCLGSAADVNLAFVNIEVRLGGCFNASTGLVSLNFLFVSGSLMVLNKFAIVFMICP